jgi:chromosomal replication initiation ATPase DnaA
MHLTQDIIRNLIKEEISKLMSEVTDSEIETNAINQIANILSQVKGEGINPEATINKAKEAFRRNQDVAAGLKSERQLTKPEKEKREESAGSFGEVLDKNAKPKDYFDDFRDSDAPQFKGKSKKKRKEMAVAAYLDAQED